MEVESHWKGNELMTSCKTGFSLLEHHVCSLDDPNVKSTIAEEPTGTIDASAVGAQSQDHVVQSQGQALTAAPLNVNQKPSPMATDEGHPERKQRRRSTDMDVDAAIGTFLFDYLQ